jgi:hypothetical protein
MAGLFISHSSLDKEFVYKICLDLVNRGFPVWFDSWEISVADSLIDKIFNGLDDSFFLIVVLSKNSVQSKWVSKELNAALAKETELNRKFIIPLKIDDADVPLKLADRIFLDFSKGYLRNLDLLDIELRKWGVHKIAVPVSKRYIPLSFIRYEDVDVTAIETGFRNFMQHNPDKLELTKDQLMLFEEPVYKLLKGRLQDRIDNIADDPYYSPELLHYLKLDFELFQALEDSLKSGVCDILNNYDKPHAHFHLNVALLWFCKIMRCRIMYTLWKTQVPDDRNPAVINFPEPVRLRWHAAGLGNNISAKEFYEANRISDFVIGDPSLGFTSAMYDVKFWMKTDAPVFDNFDYLGSRAFDYLDVSDFSKYVIPQMLVRGDRDNYIWSLHNKIIATP